MSNDKSKTIYEAVLTMQARELESQRDEAWIEAGELQERLTADNQRLTERVKELEKHKQQVAARWAVLTSELDKSVVETVERVSDENLRLRALLQKAHDEFAKTDHWYHSDIKEELAKELGL